MEKIKFIRSFTQYGIDWYDVIYKSGRCCSFTSDNLPKSAKMFLDAATSKKEEHDRTFKRTEIIYSMD